MVTLGACVASPEMGTAPGSLAHTFPFLFVILI